MTSEDIKHQFIIRKEKIKGSWPGTHAIHSVTQYILETPERRRRTERRRKKKKKKKNKKKKKKKKKEKKRKEKKRHNSHNILLIMPAVVRQSLP